MKIEWSESDEIDDGTFDLCGRFNGRYIDVVRRYDNTWSIFFNNARIKSGIANRELAKLELIKFLTFNLK